MFSNIVAGELVVPELIQAQLTPKNVANEAISILGNPDRLETIRSRLAEIRGTLGEEGVTQKIAASISEYLDLRASHEKTSV